MSEENDKPTLSMTIDELHCYAELVSEVAIAQERLDSYVNHINHKNGHPFCKTDTSPVAANITPLTKKPT